MNVGETPPEEEPDDIELCDIEDRSDGEVYEIMFVVDISSTGAEIWIFVIDARLSNLEEDSKENPYLDPFLVPVFPIAIANRY